MVNKENLPDDLPFVDIPKKWVKSLAVERESGTRWYVEWGPRQHMRHWFQEIGETSVGVCLPMQWVPDYVGVTRRAVLKRARKGGLTVFSFIVTEEGKDWRGKMQEKDTKKQYDLVPLSECVAWRELLMEKADQEG